MSDLKDNRNGWSTTSSGGGQFKRLFQIQRSKKKFTFVNAIKKNP